MSLPTLDTNATVAVDFETLNYAAIVKADASGKILTRSLTTSEKKVTQVEATVYTDDTTDPKYVPVENREQIAFKQTVKRPIVKTVAGFDELYPDDVAKLYIINQGISKYADAKVRAVLLATNEAETAFEFQLVDTYDLTDDLKQIPTRGTKLSDLDVALKTVGKLKDSNPEMFAQFMAAFQSMQQ